MNTDTVQLKHIHTFIDFFTNPTNKTALKYLFCADFVFQGQLNGGSCLQFLRYSWNPGGKTQNQLIPTIVMLYTSNIFKVIITSTKAGFIILPTSKGLEED